MLQPVPAPAATGRRRPSRILTSACAAAALLAIAGCGGGGTTDLRPVSGTAPLAAQPSATLVSDMPCYIVAIDGKDTSTFVSLWTSHNFIVAPGIHVIQIYYSDGRKYSTVHAEVGLVVTAGHTYRAFEWPPVFYDETDQANRQKAQQSLRGAVR